MAPGTTWYESVDGRNRNDVPSPTCSGSPCPRRVCTTNAFGGTSTVFQRQNPVTRTSTVAGTDPDGRPPTARNRPARPPTPPGAAIGAGADIDRFARMSCSSWPWAATTSSR